MMINKFSAGTVLEKLSQSSRNILGYEVISKITKGD